MTWNPLALATALQTVPEQNIDVTNSESALIIKLNDYGDLQINILFTSRQSEDDAVVIGRYLQRATGRVLHCFRCVIA